MASGQTLCVFTPLHFEAPSSGAAIMNIRTVDHPVLEFGDAATTGACFTTFMPRNYGGNGITATICWVAATAVAGNVIWSGAFEEFTTDLDATSFSASVLSAAAATNTTNAGIPNYTAIAFTNAQIDAISVGEAFRFRLSREGANASDNMTGNAQMLAVELRET